MQEFRKVFFPYRHEEPMPGRGLVIGFIIILFVVIPALLFLVEYLLGGYL